MQVGIFLTGGFLCCFVFLRRLVGKVRELLLDDSALIRRRFLQLGSRGLLLFKNRVPRGKVGLHAFELGFGLFLLLHLFLGGRTLLGHNLFEIGVRFGLSSALDAYLRDIIGLLLVVRRRKGGDGDGINSAAQAGNTVFAVTVGLGRLFRALLAHHLYG